MIYIQHAKFQVFVCLNTEYIMILISKIFLKKQNTKYVLFKIFLISVCDVEQANSSTEVAIFYFNFKA